MLIFNKVSFVRKYKVTMIFNNIFIHRNAYERFNSYFYELTNILIHRNAYVHRANSVTTFRLPCMEESRVNRPWNLYGKFNSFIWRSKLYSAQSKQFECFSTCHHTYIDESSNIYLFHFNNIRFNNTFVLYNTVSYLKNFEGITSIYLFLCYLFNTFVWRA